MKKISIVSLAAVSLGVTFFLINLLVIYLTGPYAWDDGAITLAYARTVAETGRFALTKYSEIVEGTSSLLLTGLMALLHILFNFSFSSFISASQFLAYFFLSITLIVVSAEINKDFDRRGHVTILVFAVFLLPMFTAEILNGMEMTLFGLLLTAYYLLYDKKTSWVVALTPLILLVRFEAIFYLGFALFLLFLFGDNKKRTFLIGLYTVMIFGLITLLRLSYFDDIFPNTIWAKMNPPYSGETFSERLSQKIAGVKEFFKVTSYLLLPVAVFYLLRPVRLIKNDLGFFIVLSFAVFTMISGKNWGYDGRMFLACLPIILLMSHRAFREASIRRLEIALIPGGRSFSFEGEEFFISVVFIAILMAHISNIDLHRENIKTAITGGYYQDLISPPLKVFVDRRLKNRPAEFDGSYGVTPENYRITGTAIEKIRIVLGLEEITFVTPDVGGLGLCCRNVRVIDSALLTNKKLAREGYGFFDDYLMDVSPHVIVTHGLWSRVSTIYDSEYFKEFYYPVVFENNLFWIRRDLLNALNSSSRLIKSEVSPGLGLVGVRYAGLPIDKNFIESMRLSSMPVYVLVRDLGDMPGQNIL